MRLRQVPLHLLLHSSTIPKEISQTFQANELDTQSEIVPWNWWRSEYTEVCAKFFSLCGSAYTSVEAPEGDCLFVFTDVVEVAEGLSEGHAVDCLGRLASVFEMNSKIGATSLGRLGRVDRRCCVSDHCWRG